MPAETRSRPFVLAGGTVAAMLTLAACGGSSGASANGASTASSSRAAGGAGGTQPRGGRGPAASGEIAAISGSTMQVQNQQSGQVAVTWTSATSFTHQVSVAASAVKVGSCVIAAGGSGTSNSATSFTAATVIVTSATGGSCDGGPGGGRPGGGMPSGAFPSGARPSGFPTGARPSGVIRAGAVASGKVTAVSGSVLTIAARDFGSSGTEDKTVTVGSATRISTQGPTTAKALAVGLCVSAEGKADSSGTVTATRVQISRPTGGQCTVGFLRGGDGG